MYELTEAKANCRLKSLYQDIFEAANEGYVQYRDSEHVGVHRPTTTANSVTDLVFAAPR